MASVKIKERQKEWAIKASAGIAAIIFCYIAMIHPGFQDIKTLRQRIVDSQQRFDLYQTIQKLKADLGAREDALATVPDRAMLLGRISDIAGQAQVDVGTLTPRTEPEGAYIKLSIEMDGRSSFFSLINFLASIEKIDGWLKVRDISVSRLNFTKPEEEKRPLRVHIMFETLLKQRIKKGRA